MARSANGELQMGKVAAFDLVCRREDVARGDQRPAAVVGGAVTPYTHRSESVGNHSVAWCGLRP